MIPSALVAKSATVGAATLGLFTYLQIGVGNEDFGTALQHSTGAGAFATVAVWAILKGRLDAHAAKLKALEEGLGRIQESVGEISTNVGILLDRDERRPAINHSEHT